MVQLIVVKLCSGSSTLIHSTVTLWTLDFLEMSFLFTSLLIYILSWNILVSHCLHFGCFSDTLNASKDPCFISLISCMFTWQFLE